MDASGSVGKENYEKQKDFIKILASRYDLASRSKAGVVVFSGDASNVIHLGSKRTALSFANAVNIIPYLESVTRIDLGLKTIYDEYFAPSASKDTQRLVILLTDGKQTRKNYMNPQYVPIQDTVQLLRAKAARIFAVGIGQSVDIREMRMVTKSEEDIFLASEFKDLVDKADAIAKTTCSVARK